MCVGVRGRYRISERGSDIGRRQNSPATAPKHRSLPVPSHSEGSRPPEDVRAFHGPLATSLSSQAYSGAEGACASLLSAWLLLGDLLICILWQELSHWSSKLSRENPSTGETHAGSIRAPPAINQQDQCILGVGGNSYLKMVEVHWPQIRSVGCQFTGYLATGVLGHTLVI